MAERLELLRTGTALFRSKLAAVPETHWTAPTPCTEWTVLDLVNHVVAGNQLAIGLLDGRPPDPHYPVAAPEIIGAVDRTTAQQYEAFRSALAERTVHHPAGRISASDFAIYRCADITVHAWDLARAVGGDTDLGPTLTEAALQPYVIWVESLDPEGLYQPPKPVDPDAPRQDQVLGRLGRRP